MTQDDINRTEWENPDNWAGAVRMAVYFSKKHSRTWMPKKRPWMDWTLKL